MSTIEPISTLRLTHKLSFKTMTDTRWRLKKLYRLYKESAYPEKQVEPYPDVASFKKGLENESIILAYANQVLIGFASYYPTHGFLHLINVHPQYQGLGVGRELMYKVIEDCLKKNYATRIKLLADINNVSAHGFYERLGFGRLNDVPIEGKNYRCYHYEKVISTRKDHNVDYKRALAETAIAGVDEAKLLGIDISEAFFSIIQRFEDDTYIKITIEPDEKGDRVINQLVDANIKNLAFSSSTDHVIELSIRTGHVDCFERPINNTH